MGGVLLKASSVKLRTIIFFFSILYITSVNRLNQTLNKPDKEHVILLKKIIVTTSKTSLITHMHLNYTHTKSCPGLLLDRC